MEEKMLKKKLKWFIVTFISLFVKRDVILFESFPELDGSPWMIYQELKRRGYGNKYRLVWAVDASFAVPENVNCILFFGKLSVKQKINRLLLNARTILIIDSNRPVRKINSHSVRIFTRHGGPLKKCTGYMHCLGKMDYILSLSPALQDIDFRDCMGYCVNDIERVLVLGFPANDRLFENKDLFLNGFYPKMCSRKNQSHDFEKIVGWLPTFRQHRDGNRFDTEEIFPFGLPLVKTENDLFLLNDLLQKKKILLAIQMHHAQMANFPKKIFSNIILVQQDLKYKMNVSTANLMHSFDALITDYSAAYHEYVLLDRPIALSIDDYDSYASKTGFVFDYFEWIKGVYLKNMTDLFHFVEDVANGVDSAKKERETAMHRIHKYIDNNSTQRVVDFLVEKVKL